jgi:hypothetical protein
VAAEAFATLNGYAVAGLTLQAAEQGPWWAEVDLENVAEKLTNGPGAKLVINGLTLSCALEGVGTHGQAKSCRAVAGGGGWGKQIAKHGYSNDAAVKARTVADDAARAAGETIGTFEPGADRLTAKYVRQAGAASIALEDAAGGSIWWVDYAGKTNVAKERPTAAAKASDYEVLAYNPRTQVVELGVTGLTVGVGSVISERLDAPATIRAVTLKLTGRKLTMTAVCGEPRTTNAIEVLLKRIVERIMNGRLFGKYRYRVVSMTADGRVNVQAVAKSAGVPDLLRVEQWPGVAGAHATLTNGAIIAVEFLEGRRDLPIVCGYAGLQSAAYVPERVTFGAEDPSTAIEVAYKGATVKVLTPPAVFQGTIVVGGVPSPAVGAVVWPSAFTLGVIEVGSPKVRVGT